MGGGSIGGDRSYLDVEEWRGGGVSKGMGGRVSRMSWLCAEI